MDKEEFRVKLGEINNLVEKQDYKGAMNVVDSIDWRRVKNVRTLCVVGEIYAANKRYKDSKDIFLLAYHRAPIGKNILYRLIEVSLKMGEIDEAMDFYEEYVEVAPNDSTQYILRYKIYKAKNASVDSLIEILEEYKEREFTEKWSYELAKLYYRAGDKKKCSDLCSEMVLWFSDGKYVVKALELKSHFTELTEAEKRIYEKHFMSDPEEQEPVSEKNKKRSVKKKKEVSGSEEEAPAIENISMDERDINNAESLQEKISKGIRDIFSGKKKDAESNEEAEEDTEEEQDEMIRDISSEKGRSSASVPDLEPEDVKPGRGIKNVSEKMNIPSLNIPEEMKKMQEKPELKKVAEQFEESDEDYTESEEEEEAAEEEKEFNLEDTILAAASAQGIEIPEKSSDDSESEETEEEEAEDTEGEEDLESSEEEDLDPSDEDLEEEESYFTEDGSVEEDMYPADKKQKDRREVPSLQEEEFLSEEDLREAEEEFLNGPSQKKKDSVKKEKPSRKSGSSRSEKMNLQDEINKILGEEDDFDDIPETETVRKKPEKPEKRSIGKSGKKQTKKEIAEEEDSLNSFIDEEEEIEDLYEEEDYEEEDSSEYEEEISEEEELEKFIDAKNAVKLNPDELIPREDDLTEDEVKLFTYFVKVPGMKDQLLDTLFDVQEAAADKTSRTGNIVVMGGRETGKTRLISSLIPAICNELNMEASKVAYVFADQINNKDISKIVSKLSGGFLVIEDANQLSPAAAEQLNKAMEFRTDGLTVIVEDEKIGMRKFMTRYPKLAKKFTSVINIPVFTNDELVNFARVYTKENGYSIDQMGMLALYNLISANQKEDEPMNIGAVKNLIDAAITKSQGGIRKLKRNISKKHTDHDGNVILYEKDFDI